MGRKVESLCGNYGGMPCAPAVAGQGRGGCIRRCWSDTSPPLLSESCSQAHGLVAREACLSLYDVDDVVAELLAFRDIVRIERAEAIVVLMVLHAREVRVPQIVAQLVDFVLYLIALAEVVAIAFRLCEHAVHLLQRHVHQVFHVADLLQLLVGEVLLAVLAFAALHACQVVAAVADALQVVHFAQHAVHLAFGIVGEPSLRHLLEIMGYLLLHVVGDALIFLHALELLHEVVVLLDAVHSADDLESLLAAFAEESHLLACLQERELGGAENTCGDELQASHFLLLVLRQHEADETLYLLDEADEEQRVEDVESRVEGGEAEEVVAAGVHEVSDYPGDGIAEGIEEYEDDEDAEDIEEHVGQGGAACLRVGGERGHECRDRRTDVLSHGEGGSLLEAEAGNLHVEEHEGDGHRGGRGLHEHRDECADDDEEDDGEESASLDVCQHIGYEGADVQAFGRTLQERQTHEEEAESEDKFSDALPLVVATENQRNANGEQWEGKGGNIHFEAYCRDDPGRDGGTDVGTHDDANGLREVHQSGIDEADDHHSGCARRLDECCDEDSGDDAHEAVLGHCGEDGAQAVAGKFFQTFGHDFHTVKEESERAQQAQQVEECFHKSVYGEV